MLNETQGTLYAATARQWWKMIGDHQNSFHACLLSLFFYVLLRIMRVKKCVEVFGAQTDGESLKYSIAEPT